jgi:plasmid maintenance system killer protein
MRPTSRSNFVNVKECSAQLLDELIQRINDQYRLGFVWTNTGPDEVEIVDYH